MDVTAEDDVAAAVADRAAARWNPHGVVANAAVQLFGSDAPIADLDLAVWQRTVDVNLTGTFLTVKHAVRALLARG
ncbi:SDR family oxidoreductase, partial [Vibrio parahaemolyticus]